MRPDDVVDLSVVVPDYADESAFRKRCMDDLSSMGFLVYAISDSRGQLGDAGYPDITAAKNGCVVFVECKVGRGRMAKAQKDWRDAITPLFAPSRMHYCQHYEARPENWDDILAELQGVNSLSKSTGKSVVLERTNKQSFTIRVNIE